MGQGGASSQEGLDSGVLGGGEQGREHPLSGLTGTLGAVFFPVSSDVSLPSFSCARLLQQIMKDKWINIGYEGEELKPYTEPEEDFGDTKRIGEGQGEQVPQLCRARGTSFLLPAPVVGASEKFTRQLEGAEKSGLHSLCSSLQLCDPEQVASPLCDSVPSSVKWDDHRTYLRVSLNIK